MGEIVPLRVTRRPRQPPVAASPRLSGRRSAGRCEHGSHITEREARDLRVGEVPIDDRKSRA